MPEKKRILKMIEEGKISAVEGLELLERLEILELEEEKNKNIVEEKKVEKVKNSSTIKQAKFLRIKIEEKNDGHININIKLPLFLLKLGSKIFRKKIEAEIGGNTEINIDEIFLGIKNGLIGPIIDLETEEEKILITLE